jgi:hypothetical protein
MVMKRNVSSVIVLLCIIAFIVSCTRGPEKAVLGKWQNTRVGSEKLKFYKNGVLEIYDGDDVKGRVRYEFVGENQIKVTSGSVVEVIKIAREGKQLKWNLDNPEKLTIYKKIK